MRKRLLTIFVAAVVVLVSSAAMAIDYGELGFVRRWLGDVHTAGTIENSPEGKGDALIFPYYDVRDVGGSSQDTYFAIINEDTGPTVSLGPGVTPVFSPGVAAKLRFREWDKSEEVFDADIWLSRADVWVGRISRNIATNQARLFSDDYVITANTGVLFSLSTPLSAGFDFFWLAGYPAISDNRLGYFEVIGEEATAEHTLGAGPTWTVTRYPDGGGNYPDCPNTLMGYAYIVRPTRGVAYGYRAQALANFARTWQTLFQSPGGLRPSLADCEDSLDQLEFEISREDVMAGYDIDPTINGAFSLIVTFPTKHFHFSARPLYTLTTVPSWAEPFTSAFMNTPGEPVRVRIYDRSEHTVVPTTTWWSPSETPTIALPYEVNVISLYQGTPPPLYPANPSIRDNVAFSTGVPGFINGWLWLNFQDHARLIRATGVRPGDLITRFAHMGTVFEAYLGLPLVSIWLQEAENAALTGGLYGEVIPSFTEAEWRVNTVGPNTYADYNIEAVVGPPPWGTSWEDWSP